MGYANILIVRDDAIQKAQTSEIEQKKFEAEVGAAVIKLCLDPEYVRTEHGRKRIIDATVFNHSNGVTWEGEVHSSDRQVYAWIRNCLRPISELDKDELTVVKDIVDHQNPNPPSKGYDHAVVMAHVSEQLENMDQRGLPLRDGRRWGRWVLRAGSLCLEPEHGGGHYIDLGKINDPASMLHEMFGLFEKSWMSDGDRGWLLRALEEIFDARETLFPDGKAKSIDAKAYLHKRIIAPDAEGRE